MFGGNPFNIFCVVLLVRSKEKKNLYVLRRLYRTSTLDMSYIKKNTSLIICFPLPEMVASQMQMNLAQLPLEQRDYCAQHLLKLMKCKRDNWPNFLACKHERHDWDYCEHQE